MDSKKLEEVLADLTLEEKVGQLVQVTPDFFGKKGEVTGPMTQWTMEEKELFQIGSVLGTHRKEEVINIQKEYLARSSHKIPLLFMADVIHGYETIFPIPLALASSFDQELIEKVAAASAKEAASEGIHVTFSPMADHVKDPRWGRVLESNGEDPRLSKALTEAYVHGYQGKNLNKEEETVAACVKHFIGYGAVEGGREYNQVALSDLEMYQNYLPAFEGAIQAGVKMVMTAFTTIHGIPMTGNQKLVKQVLREKLEFDGVVISDWAAVSELIAHRVAGSEKEAAQKAFQATIDMDMMSSCYLHELATLIREEELEKELDLAVLRVLQLKNDLGLFEHPYRGMTIRVDEASLRKLSYQAATRSAVLLKNEHVLPLKKEEHLILVGTKAATKDVLGAWSWIGDQREAISLQEGMEAEFAHVTVFDIETLDFEHLEELNSFAQADKIILAVGETSGEAGEAASKTNLELKKEEKEWITKLAEQNDQLILILMSGRPMILTEDVPKVKGVVSAWFLGSETGHALAALLSGKENFSGHLPMSFPRSVGQLPFSYQEMSTGRPKTINNSDQKYISRYLEEANSALYPFGYGLSYSDFVFSHLTTLSTELRRGEPVDIQFSVTNTSSRDGIVLPQIYFQDMCTEVTRPQMELIRWQPIFLQAGETQKVHFRIAFEEFAYVHSDLEKYTDSGKYQLFLGENAKKQLSEVVISYVE